jgi:hypothetical protein
MSGPSRSTTPDPTTEQFIQGIGPAAAISLAVGSMIGSGIFIVSADISPQVAAWGPGGLMIVVLGVPVYFLWHRRGHGGA